jgi:hypothetical protein
LKTTVRHGPAAALGFTHASSVMPLLRSSEPESGIVTEALDPSNDSAGPNLPEAFHVVPEVLPLFPVPDASVTAVPELWFKP